MVHKLNHSFCEYSWADTYTCTWGAHLVTIPTHTAVAVHQKINQSKQEYAVNPLKSVNSLSLPFVPGSHAVPC